VEEEEEEERPILDLKEEKVPWDRELGSSVRVYMCVGVYKREMRRPARVARTEMGEHGPGRTRETYCRRYPCYGRASGKRRTGIWADSRLSDDHAPTPVHNPYPPCPYIPIPSQTHSNIRCHALRGTL